jgi:hypothetical protein
LWNPPYTQHIVAFRDNIEPPFIVLFNINPLSLSGGGRQTTRKTHHGAKGMKGQHGYMVRHF